MWLATGLICSSFFVYASGAWLPSFFIRVHGMTTAEVGRYSAIAVGFGGGIGTLGAGFVCDLLRRHDREVELKVLMVTLGLGVPALLTTLLVSDRTVALMSLVLFNICAYAYLGPTVTLIQKESAPESRGLAIAICISLSNILNLGFGLPLVGSLSDALTPSLGREALGYALALSALATGFIGMFAHWQARRAARSTGAVAHT
jgi:hypothetical protein